MSPKTERDLWVEMSVQEISTQAQFADISYGNLGTKGALGTELVFSSIHSFLSHCAMISKMLLADDGESSPQTIGDILGIPRTSPIHNRKFRNHLEHYDERLKQWIADRGVNASIGTYNIGPKSSMQIPGLIMVSHYDPTTDVFTFVDEDFDLGIQHKEAGHIKNVAEKWLRSRSR